MSSVAWTITVTSADALHHLFGRMRVRERAKVDLVVFVSDNESWVDSPCHGRFGGSATEVMAFRGGYHGGVFTFPVGVPVSADGWGLDWLAQNVGYLDGTAFPGWDGNSVLTGHVYLPDGSPGPFQRLGSLRYGDRGAGNVIPPGATVSGGGETAHDCINPPASNSRNP